jgi:hypothetical protein
MVELVAPPRVRVADMEALPVGAPKFNVVAAPAKLTVVAVVLSKSKLVEPVVKEVVSSGEVLITTFPLPVIALETRFLLPSVNTA